MSVDPKVHALAELFLKGANLKNVGPEDIKELAEDIQQTIEDAIAWLREDEDEEDV